MRFDLHSISAGLALALGLAGCGRTEALVELGNDELADDDTFSFEETATSDDIADEAETTTESESDTNETSTESGTDENEDFTTEWSDDVIDTWGTEDFDTFETFDTSTDIDTFDTFETFDTFDTFDTSTDIDTFDTSTDVDTFDTSTDVSTTDSSSSDTSPGPTCSEAAQCLIDCGSFDNMCINQCTMDLGDAEAAALFDLQICAVQSCFFLGLCTLGDFNAPECVDCRFDVNADPDGFGCSAEGMACGI